MGVVYKAWQGRLHRGVAVKMILPGFDDSESGLARFRVEAEAVARLRHPNIVQLFELGDHDGRPYLVMELADGGSLAERLTGRPGRAVTPRGWSSRLHGPSTTPTSTGSSTVTSLRETSFSSPTARPSSATSAWRSSRAAVTW